MALDIGTGEITLNDILRNSLDGILVLNRDRHVVYFSEACERMTGIDRQSVIGSTCACFQITGCQDEHGRMLSGVLCPAVKIFNGDIPHATQRMRLTLRDDKIIWVETNYTPIRDERGEVTSVVGIMRDVTFLKEKEDDLRQWAQNKSSQQEETIKLKSAPGSLQTLPSRQPITTVQNDNGPLDRMLSLLERREIVGALDRASGQRTLAAKLLGISRSRLYRRMEALNINPRDTISF